MEVRLLESKLLRECGIFWSKLVAETDTLYMHLVAASYGYSEPQAEKLEYWKVVLTML